MPAPDPIGDEVLRHLFIAAAEEMGVALERTAYSPNIKERRDYSCAAFDADGALIAQAAHIPVHLGAFPRMMEHLVPAFPWRPGDVVITNDPFVGGTHLPDVSLVAPVISPGGRRAGFVACRAHHADVGGRFPGSMGPARESWEEGVVIPPLRLVDGGTPNAGALELFLRNVRTPRERRGDLEAQLAALATGLRRVEELVRGQGTARIRAYARRARTLSRRRIAAWIESLGALDASFEDLMEGVDPRRPIRLRCRARARNGRLVFDWAGSSPQVAAPVNATLAVTCAAVYYCVIGLCPERVQINQGVMDCVEVLAPPGSVVNAAPPAAVAAGNVETSQRIVDVVLGALASVLPDRTPAASQGTMNNLTIGGRLPASGRPWTYYETIGGGSGGGPHRAGASAIHCHMSNTRNTPVEALEFHYPLRVVEYSLRDGSGGAGSHPGGCGVCREIELLAPAVVTLLTERRTTTPYGLAGGGPGMAGRNLVNAGGGWREVAPRCSRRLNTGDRVRIETPGGGGWGPTTPLS